MRYFFTLLLILTGWGATQLAAQAQGLQLLSSVTTTFNSQGAYAATAAPNRLYLANFGEGSFSIYDMSQPTAPVRLSTLPGVGRTRTIELGSTKVYIGTYGIGSPSTSTLYAIDVSNATKPVLLKAVTLPAGVPTTTATSTLVCSAVYAGPLYVFDTDLNQLSTISVACQDIVLNDNYLYVLSGQTLLTYNLSVPATPILLSTVTVGPYTAIQSNHQSLAVTNNHLYIRGHTGIFSLSNPASPTLDSQNSLTFDKVSGSTAYQLTRDNASGKYKVTVTDLRVPTAPIVAASALVANPAQVDFVTGYNDLVYAVTSNYDYINTYRYTAIPLSTHTAVSTIFALHPNPVDNEVTLELPTIAGADQRVLLYNVSGQLLREQMIPAGSIRTTISLAELNAGVYLLRYGSTIQKLFRR